VLLAENDELLLLATKAVCIGVFVGIESVSAAALSEANKGFNRAERLKDNIARFHDRGILVDGGIIFGFDTDPPDVFDRTIDALEKVRIDSVAVNILIPYPGTEFYRKFEKQGRIICTDYTKYTGNTVIIRPKNMTIEQLQAGYNNVILHAPQQSKGRCWMGDGCFLKQPCAGGQSFQWALALFSMTARIFSRIVHVP
jgi:radical SAM superfamily enzyme